MAAEDKIGIVGSTTKAIQDAWTFFIPPLFHLLVAGLVFVWLGGGSLVAKYWLSIMGNVPKGSLQSTLALLDQLKLTSLVPILVLILLAVGAYAWDKFVMGIGGLVPVGLAYSYPRLLAAVGAVSIWYKFSAIHDLNQLRQVIEVQIASQRTGEKEAVLANVDYWAKRRDQYTEQFTFAKFLLLWVFFCGWFLWPRRDGQLVVAVLGSVLWAWLALVRAAYAAWQLGFGQVTVVSAMLAGAPELEPQSARRIEIDEQIKQETDRSLNGKGWWWIGVSPFSWVSVLPFWDDPISRCKLWWKRRAMMRSSTK